MSLTAESPIVNTSGQKRRGKTRCIVFRMPPSLVVSLDQAAQRFGCDRSTFIREAVRVQLLRLPEQLPNV